MAAQISAEQRRSVAAIYKLATIKTDVELERPANSRSAAADCG